MSQQQNEEHGEDQQQQQELQQDEQSNQEDDNNPVITLVQSIGTRPYQTVMTTIHQTPLAILKFQRGLSLLMSPSCPLLPAMTGQAHLVVYRKFLPTFGKYLHWIKFSFNGSRVLAQIMLPRRLGAACNLVAGGAAAVFMNPPLQRRSIFKNKRRCKNKRTMGS